MSWKVIYHYADDEEEGATWSFDGTSNAYDRADRIELVAPDGEVVDTHYVTDDAAKADGFEGRGEDGRGVPLSEATFGQTYLAAKAEAREV